MSKEINKWERSRLRHKYLFGLFEWFIGLPLMAVAGFMLVSSVIELLGKWSSTQTFPDPSNFIAMLILVYLVWVTYEIVEGAHEKALKKLGDKPESRQKVMIREVAA